MENLLANGYEPKVRPSGHEIGNKFGKDNGGAIPPNLIAVVNTDSNSAYLRYCKEHGLRPHPARFPSTVPEYFIRMLTDEGDLVIDPFGGGCVTGEVCEKLHRKWICCDTMEEYVAGAVGRFIGDPKNSDPVQVAASYVLQNPSKSRNGIPSDMLEANGGKTRPKAKPASAVIDDGKQ
ncbi:MAG: site-specific DNA-methyltransferase [Actinomycetia bacterium]|nr:site-specific DNA-methyltransferase [Actinomycetes bacterium]